MTSRPRNNQPASSQHPTRKAQPATPDDRAAPPATDDTGQAVETATGEVGPPPAFPDQPRDQWDPQAAPGGESGPA